MAGADTASEILIHAGFEDIALHRHDEPITIGADIDEAIEVLMALGPAGEILRLQGDRAAHLHGKVHEALQDGLSDMATPEGVRGMASTWIVKATKKRK
jgi:hypothetical protein